MKQTPPSKYERSVGSGREQPTAPQVQFRSAGVTNVTQNKEGVGVSCYRTGLVHSLPTGKLQVVDTSLSTSTYFCGS